MNIADSVPAFKSVWDYLVGLNRIEQAVILTFGGLIAIGGGWKVVVSFFKWCLDRHDGKILHVLQESLREARISSPRPGMNITLAPAPLANIALAANRREKSVYRSLRRLESAGKVEEGRNGWILARQSHPTRQPVTW